MATPDLHLILGNRNYSSWSMRAWVALRAADIEFRESAIRLHTSTADEEKARYSPAGRVPVLELDGFAVWDSLAICETAAELFPDRGMWPADARHRMRARSLCAEMHAGFPALRTELPMNIRRTRALRDGPSPAVGREVERIAQIFDAARGPFLFGEFGIADAFFAPVCCRLRGYGIPLAGAAADYAGRVLAHPAVEAWCQAARAETSTIPAYDAVP